MCAFVYVYVCVCVCVCLFCFVCLFVVVGSGVFVVFVVVVVFGGGLFAPNSPDGSGHYISRDLKRARRSSNESFQRQSDQCIIYV